MAEFYYGLCPVDGLLWKCANDGRDIMYICRYRNKGKPVQDLEKAKWYLNRAIEDYKKNKEGD